MLDVSEQFPEISSIGLIFLFLLALLTIHACRVRSIQLSYPEEGSDHRKKREASLKKGRGIANCQKTVLRNTGTSRSNCWSNCRNFWSCWRILQLKLQPRKALQPKINDMLRTTVHVSPTQAARWWITDNLNSFSATCLSARMSGTADRNTMFIVA